MESRLKQESIHAYSKDFASSVAASFFNGKTKISGEEILKLSEIQQVNLFVLMHLFQTWEKESTQLESPYFNYDHPDVRKALNNFQNTISNHIEITKQDFIPLLEAAVEKTLNLIFSPYHFYIDQISKTEHTHDLKLKKLMKYIRINPGLLNALIDRMEESKSYEGKELVRLFDEVCAESPGIPEDFDEYLNSFSKIIPLSLEMIYTEEESENKDEVKKEIQSTEIDLDKKTLNDTFNKEQKTLNDQIKAKLDSTLAEIHQNKKIDHLVKSISINQRYQFTKELFAGDKNSLEQVIEEIDSMETLENAVSFSEEIANRNNWDMESEEAIEFMLLIRRRFNTSEDPL